MQIKLRSKGKTGEMEKCSRVKQKHPRNSLNLTNTEKIPNNPDPLKKLQGHWREVVIKRLHS